MDIIDIMLAKAMTPQGKTDAYVAKAYRAAQKAAQAEEDATAAIASVTAAASDIAATQQAAETLLATAQQAQLNMLDTEDVDTEIKKMTISTGAVEGNDDRTVQIITSYPDNTTSVRDVITLYKTTGNNSNGGMTQKAITDALATKADASTAATKQYVDNAIAQIPTQEASSSSNVNINLNSSNAGHIVVVDDNGNLIAGTPTENALIEALIRSNSYVLQNAIGLDIDYANRTFTRVQEAATLSMGSDFNTYKMYGGRTRCNVADDGTITAFYGDNNYAEDGSNGQVMVYQPKFYYKRIIRNAEDLSRGQAIRHETLILSDNEQSGFKLAPIFSGNLDYVLFPAFDAGLVNDKLTSIAGVKPVVNLNINQAEAYANARGTGWHIMNMAAESANQMLEMVEFGTLNGQSAIEQGITITPNGGTNTTCLFITGSTSSLGNGTGHADSTQVDINNVVSTNNVDGLRAISYRGMENPWGNLWSMIAGVNIVGSGNSAGGSIMICEDFNYSNSSKYHDIGFNLPNVQTWVNAFGYSGLEYDWVYLPAECSESANSSLPIGDGIWTVTNLNGSMIVASGGSYGFREECGPFYYACDRTVQDSARRNYGAKLLYVPTKNATYTANIAKWNTYMGG